MDCKLKFRRSPTIRNYIGQWWVVTKWFLLLNSFNCSIVVEIVSVKCSTETIAFLISEVGPLLRLKTCKGAEAPPSPPLASKWPREKAHHPLLERFLGRQRKNRSARELFYCNLSDDITADFDKNNNKICKSLANRCYTTDVCAPKQCDKYLKDQ